MRKYKMLILTDHKNHSSENSLYALARAMREEERCERVDVATRYYNENADFFNTQQSDFIAVKKVTDSFAYKADGSTFSGSVRTATAIYDVIWLRMPPPLPKNFLDFLSENFSDKVIINDPAGIYQTGSKAFLLNFPEVCPPMQLCQSLEDIISFKNQFPIVLKPFREYGGKGIVRIDGEQVWDGKQEMTFDEFAEKLKGEEIAYLGVKFLKNVREGDKRIVVVHGKIMGASLRLPAEGSWLCNVAMGGTAKETEVSPEEIEIVNRINPQLLKMGIVMYGVDTLMGDDGKRILSEINTTSIGGLPQIAVAKGEPLVEKAVDLFWNYIVAKAQVTLS